ncbi:MAG: SusC/RagA family TonB-linked outer membrane protein [Bacteroidetes bacterium]|nr:SusC/RagA family TonB-linked outer membrane protein [Bacteroidota bacterium]MBS1973516.1 SusC/RagA family TonB-linked outer membrane protein [Bacteroidota bacterium]
MRKFKILLTGILLLVFLGTHAQRKEVTGKVTDATGNPVPGASIKIKGTKSGTSADANGTFKISVPANAILIISGIGFETEEISVANSETITASLRAANSALSEVVVTALGIKREKKALGYAVSTVDKKELELRPESDLGRVLSGKAPGLNITSTSGLSGSGTNINIRGISTITGNSNPLFIVDGVPFDGSTNAQANFTYGHQTSSRFLDLDPNNIENVNVLKGLTAVTLYGEEGRNGVILITTKNGATQKSRKKMEISVSQSYFETKPVLPEYNTEYGGGFDLSLGIAFFSNWGAKFVNPPVVVKHPYDKPALAAAFPQYQGAPYYYKYYNSVPRFFRTGNTSTTSVNVGGSTPTVNYNMSYSYTDDQGYVIGNGLRKNSFGFGGTAKLTNKFTLSGTINYVMTAQKSPPTSNSYGNNPVNASVFGNVLYTPTAVDLMGLPYENPLNHSSIYYRNGNDIQNPRWTLYNSFTNDNVNRVFGQISTVYDIAKGINVMYRVGLDNYTEYQDYSQNKGGIYTPTGFLRTSNGVSTIWDHTFLINVNKNLGTNFTLNVNAGGNQRRDIYSQTGQTSQQQLVYGILNHSNFVSHSETSEDGSQLNFNSQTLDLAVFGLASLGYRDFAYLTLGGRNSWKSTVEANNRSIFYPNASLAFIPTSAIAGLQNSKVVNYLKLRLGYSTSANFPPAYQTRSYLYTATNQFQTSKGIAININAIPNSLPNPNLKPELLKETEAGIEGKFFNNRISLDLTLYSRVADQQILDRPLDPSTGYTDEQINAGQVANKGIEVQLGLTVVQTKDWRWELTGLYTLNKSKVSNIPTDLKDIVIAGYSNEGVFAKNGYAYGVIEANYFERDPKTGKRLVGTDGNYINSNDIAVIGDPNAQYKLTGISTLSYKSFSFRMQWDYTQGGDMYSGTAGALLGRGVTRDTQFDRRLPLILPGVLQTTGQPNNIQISSAQAFYGNSITNGAADESAIFDATCIRLREASLSYSIPQGALSKLPFGSVSLTISGTNLWYYAPNFPKYIHFDPESDGLGVGNGRGFDFLTGPSARRFGASIRVTF